MKYFNEMRDKFGFSDGEATPAEAWVYRKIYVEVINAVAKKLHSETRAVEYDRPGVHNACLIMFAKEEQPKRKNKRKISFCDPDDAMEEAFMLADSDLDVDSLVTTTAHIDAQAANQLMAAIRKGTAIEGLNG